MDIRNSTTYEDQDTAYVVPMRDPLGMEKYGAYLRNQIKNEKKYIYEVVHVLPELGLQLATGISSAREFFPAVKLTLLPYIGTEGSCISFNDTEWRELINNLEKKQYIELPSFADRADEITYSTIPCDDSEIVKIENFEGCLYLCQNIVHKILYFNDFILKRLLVLDTYKFRSFYWRTLEYVAKNFNYDYIDNLIKLCRIHDDFNSYCMFEFALFNPVKVLDDLGAFLRS